MVNVPYVRKAGTGIARMLHYGPTSASGSAARQHGLGSTGRYGPTATAKTRCAVFTLPSCKLEQPDVPVVAFTAWQLTAGGLVLSVLAVMFEPPLPDLTLPHIAGFLWLGLIGAALTYGLWLRGIARLEPQTVSLLGMQSPVVAVALVWQFLGQGLDQSRSWAQSPCWCRSGLDSG